MAAEKSPTGSHSSKKNLVKVPKRIHKAEREKLKREQLNELFLRLADSFELKEQNNGKASILGEATRFVKDMLDQIRCLKKENATLLSESQYVTVEKNELEAETSALQFQIGELKSVIKKRRAQTSLDLNIPPVESQELHVPPYFPDSMLKLPVGDPLLQRPSLNPVFIIPACPDFQVQPQPNKPLSNLTKPHPRYPSSSDSWPFQLLDKSSQQVEKGSQRDQVLGQVLSM